MHTNTIEFVRPGRATHAWVARTVAELKGGDPLAPVTLVVPNHHAGRQIRWTLAMAGGYVNVRSMLLGDLAEQIVGVDTTAQEPLTPVLEQSAVRKATCLTGGVLAPVAHHPALHQTLLQLFRELRRSETQLDSPPSAMAEAALAAFNTFERLIHPYADRTTLRTRAVDLDPTGRRAFLYDYKTGSTNAYSGMNDDAVMAGKHVQLILYRQWR